MANTAPHWRLPLVFFPTGLLSQVDTATLTNAYAIRMFDEAMKSRVRVEQGATAASSSSTRPHLHIS